MSLRGSWPVQLLCYGAAGLAAAGVDLSSFWLLTSPGALDPLIVNPISRSLGGCACFILNKVWTFEQGLRPRFVPQLGKFWIVFLVSTLLSETLLWGAIRGLGLPELGAKAGVEAVIFFFNFAVLRGWAFR